MLLVAAGLLVGSFLNLLGVDKGFDTERLLTTRLTLPGTGLERQARAQIFRDVLARVSGIPGVLQAGLVSTLPLQGEDWVDLVQREGERRPAAELPPANYRFCSPGYFETMGIRFTSGGPFTDAGRERRVAVVSETTARLLWPGENAVGRKFKNGSDNEPPFEVVGVVRDVSVGLDRKAVATVYLPYWSSNDRPAMSLALHTAADPRAAARSVRQAVWAVNRDTVVGELRTMDGVVAESVAGRRFQVLLTGGFAVAALLLACLGIYGVVSWSAARRRNEIGVRLALGAQRGELERMVIVQGLRPVLAGLAVGLLAALGLGGVLGSLLFGISARDPLTFAVVGVSLTGVAALACYIPARRAASADPLEALRHE
jgi:predicted permease